MFGGKKKEKETGQEDLRELQTQLQAVFKDIPKEIPLLLFTDPGINDVFSQAARQVIRAFRKMTPKITLREYTLDH